MIRLFSIATGDSTILPVPLRVPDLLGSDDGWMLAYADGHRQFLVPLRDTAERIQVVGHTGGSTVAELAPGGRLLATTGKDGAIHLSDPAVGRLVRTNARNNALGQTLGFSPDGRWMVVGEYEHTQIEILPVEGGEERFTLDERSQSLTWGCSFSPDGRWLVAVGNTGVRIWELSPIAGKSGGFPWEPRLTEEFPGNFRNLVFEPEGRWFAYTGQTVGNPVSVIVRRLDPPFEVSTSSFPVTFPIQSLGVVPGRLQLALGASDAREISKPGVARPLRFMDPEKLEVVRSVSLLAEGEAVATYIANLRISPDGSRLAAASHDGRRVNIYDVASGRRLYSLGEDAGVVWWLAWHADGRRLAVTRDTGDVSIWKLPEVEAALAAAGLTGASGRNHPRCSGGRPRLP